MKLWIGERKITFVKLVLIQGFVGNIYLCIGTIAQNHLKINKEEIMGVEASNFKIETPWLPFLIFKGKYDVLKAMYRSQLHQQQVDDRIKLLTIQGRN